MQETTMEEGISQLRTKNRAIISSLRKDDRNDLLKQKRMSLSEVEKFTQDLTLNQFMELVLEVKQKRGKVNIEILKKIKNSCCNVEYIKAFFRISGALESLIRYLKYHDAQVQLETVACLINLACSPHKLCFRVAKATGAYLVSFISGSSHYLQDQGAWAVGNIANDCIECYAILKSQGVFPALLKALTSPIGNVTQSTVYALSACLKYGDLDLLEINKEMHINYILKLIEDEKLPQIAVRDAAYTLTNALFITVAANLDSYTFDVDKLLICLKWYLFNKEKDIMVAQLLIRCLGYLTVYDQISTFIYMDKHFSEIAVKVLNDGSHDLMKELFWVLTNISVFQVIDTDNQLFLPILNAAKILLNPLDPSALAVLYYICSLTTHSRSSYSFYQEHGIFIKIEALTTCGKSELENASKMCLNIIKNHTDS